MENTKNNSEIEAIRSLYPNKDAELNEYEIIMAQARLEQIIATNPHQAPRESAKRKVPSPAWRWVAVPVAVAAGIVGAIMLPNSPTLPAAQASLSTWTPDPSPLTGPKLEIADAACQPTMLPAQTAFDSDGGPVEIPAQLPYGTPIAGELRNDWALLTYYFPNDDVTPTDPHVLVCLAWFSNPDEAEQKAAFSSGGPFTFSIDLAGEALTGTVLGTDIEADNAVIHVPSVGDVTATVADGVIIAWWPTGEEDISQITMQPDGSHRPDLSFTFTVTSQDGAFEVEGVPNFTGCEWSSNLEEDAITLACN